jgi:hypothetical protein
MHCFLHCDDDFQPLDTVPIGLESASPETAPSHSWLVRRMKRYLHPTCSVHMSVQRVSVAHVGATCVFGGGQALPVCAHSTCW